MKITDSLVFVYDKDEFSGVQKISKKVANDVKLVFGFEPVFLQDNGDRPLKIEAPAVIFGTAGKSAFIDELEKNGSVDLTQVRGKNEVYGFYVFDNTIVVAGSDKRGTIYGLFHISELLGVSPLVDWADVLPAKKESVEFEEGTFISKEPSVRFRGFFINDEWPATGNWCNHNFGGFNTKMYEHVFELLLRMKGNYLWPAMWSSRFSDDGPGLANAELADELGVIMGASHHEPCCRAGEEYRYLRGKDSIYGDAWNFRTNEKGITKFWEDGLKRNGKFENVITVGMRGEADTAIMQNATLKDNIDLLRDVIKTQNSLIKQYVNEDIQQVPRMLALYKEVEPYFYGDKKTKGLMDDPELDGVTLMLCDDNHGNLRTVPTEKMRGHKGGYGMYYHFDYHGSPFSYEWINSTALPKVKEQMCAAYDFGIRELWIVNVGDVMTNEFPLNYFLDLAYDYEKYSDLSYTTNQWTKEWVQFNFPTLPLTSQQDVKYILDAYTQLSHLRRPEALQPDTYHPINNGESDYMIALAESVIAKACKLYAENVEPSTEAAAQTLGWIPEGVQINKAPGSNTGLFAQVIYPALGTMNVLRMQLYSGKNKWFAAHGCIAANAYATIVKNCYNFDKILVEEYDKIAGGKFYAEGWSEHFGFQNWCEAASKYPAYTFVEPTRKGRLIAYVEGNCKTTTGQDWTDRNLRIDAFKNPDCTTTFVYIAQCGEKKVEYKVSLKNEEKDRFVEVTGESKMFGYNLGGSDAAFDRLVIKINREKLAAASVKKDTLIIEGNDGHGAGIKVFVEIDADVPFVDYPKGTFVQTGDCISMFPQHIVNAEKGSQNEEWKALDEYRMFGAMKSFPVIKSYEKGKGAPALEYHFVPRSEGVYGFDFYLNPSNPAYKDNKLQFIAEVNGEKLLCNAVDPEEFAVGDHQEPWGTDVTNNCRIATVYADCKKGINVLKVYPVTPNIVLEKIEISEADVVLPSSYLGSPETFRVK